MKSLIGTLLFSILFISACDEDELLNKDNPNAVTVNTFYQTEADAILGVTSVYASWQARGLMNRMYFFANDMPSDENIGTNNLQSALRQMLDYTFESNNGVLFEMWRDYYQGVARANRFLAGVEDIEMDATLKNRLIGEARFLRATFYFDLANKWGDVPLITIPPDDAINQPRASQAEVFQLVEDDLTFAKNNLLTKDQYDASDAGRATSGAAAAYLGKLYLFQERWAEAETEFDAVINGTYGTYRLVEDFRLNGIGEEQSGEAENNDESLFEVQFQDALGGVWGIDNNGGGENTFRAVEYDFGSFNNVRPKQEFADRFELGDPRYEQTFYDDSVAIWNGDVFRRDDWGSLIAWRKYSNRDIRPDNNQSSGINFRLLRYSDLLLMAAEAKLNNGKSDAEVLALVNQVRQRAIDQKTNPNITLYMDRTLNNTLELYPTAEYPAGSAAELMTIIMHEREVELAGEQKRYDDLRRWGLDDDIAIASGKPYQVGKHELFPIPIRELDTNSEITQADQNPGY